MAELRGFAGDDRLDPLADDASGTALLPRSVRRWVVGALVFLVAAAGYLIAVRGTAILFDLRDAVSAICM